ncbi:hypothetical protein GGQ68_000368 [Sagittula marina]|uniref:Uncharacterized protein n=1 Tax=Sagittula marina TaxID=943940 RepID=A0A7W6DNM5_9RHOB|nr:hypothetical protein [Sagittula marina]
MACHPVRKGRNEKHAFRKAGSPKSSWIATAALGTLAPERLTDRSGRSGRSVPPCFTMPLAEGLPCGRCDPRPE